MTAAYKAYIEHEERERELHTYKLGGEWTRIIDASSQRNLPNEPHPLGISVAHVELG